MIVVYYIALYLISDEMLKHNNPLAWLPISGIVVAGIIQLYLHYKQTGNDSEDSNDLDDNKDEDDECCGGAGENCHCMTKA